MMLEGDDVSGTQLEVYANVDLSDITDMVENPNTVRRNNDRI